MAKKRMIFEGDDVEISEVDELPYELKGVLGHGQTCVVEKVMDTITGKFFALKKFSVTSGSLNEVRELHKKEAEIIRRLGAHPHIITVFATYIAGRELGVVLKPVARCNLPTFLAEFRDLPDEDVDKHLKGAILERTFGCLATGLSFMHNSKIRHRDIKPDNILIHEDYVLYSDFGISRDFWNDQSTSEGPPGSFTRRYCAPEVANYDIRNRKSDVFSLGCVFLEIYSALNPVEELDEFLTKTYHREIESIEDRLRNHSGICSIILQMLKRSLESRPSAVDVVARIAELPGHYFCDKCRTDESRQSDLNIIDPEQWRWSEDHQRHYSIHSLEDGTIQYIWPIQAS